MDDQKRVAQTYRYFGVLTLFNYLIAPNQYLVHIPTRYMRMEP